MALKKAKEIINGYTNLFRSVVGLTDEQEEELFAARQEVCNSCENRTKDNRCGLCHCPLGAKTKSVISSCPIEKW